MTPTEPTGSRAAGGPPPRWLGAIMNGLIGALLRSPLHRPLSEQLMLISFVGRRSGRRYTTPVSRIETGERLQIFTRTRWWKNLRGGAPVTLTIEGRRRQGQAEATADAEVVLSAARGFLSLHGPGAARRIGLSLPPDRQPDEAELRAALRDYALITVTLEG